MQIDVKNEGITNWRMFAKDGNQYDIEALLKCEKVIETIKYMCNSNTVDKRFHFENLCNRIYTCIKTARSHNFGEDFWSDWETPYDRETS